MCAAAEERLVEEATSSQTGAKGGQQSGEAGEKEAGQPQQLRASAGMRHMRRKMGKGKAPRRIRKQKTPASPTSSGDMKPHEETRPRESSSDSSMPGSASAAPEGRAAVHAWEGAGSGAPASQVVYSTVSDSGMVMWRPGHRLNTAASCLQSTAPKVLLRHHHSDPGQSDALLLPPCFCSAAWVLAESVCPL